MFRIYDKSMSDEEILELNKLWVGMCERLWSDCGCLHGDPLCYLDCKYKRLCRSICDSCQRIEKVLKERNLISD